MPHEITFPNTEPEYDFDRDCVVFPALAEGKPIRCFVTAELLMSHFGAQGPEDGLLKEAFEAHKRAIQEIAKEHVQNGWIDPDNRVFLTKRHTILESIFSENLDQSPSIRSHVEKAHQYLVELIGPRSEEVSIEWQRKKDYALPSVQIKLMDRTTGFSSTALFRESELQDPLALFRNILAPLWGNILRDRSQKLILKMG